MALTVATNTGALMAQAAASSVNKEMEISMERLSTGKRINSAADDAAGVAIASRLTSEIKGTNMAIRNAMDGQAMIDTAEGAHQEIETILQRMRELAVQASNDSNSDADRTALQAEVDALVNEIDRIANVSTWAGKGLIDAANTFKFNVGSHGGGHNEITTTTTAMTGAALGVKAGNATVGANGATAKEVGESTIEFAGTPAVGDIYSLKVHGEEISLKVTGQNAGETAFTYSFASTSYIKDDGSGNAVGVAGDFHAITVGGASGKTTTDIAKAMKAAIDAVGAGTDIHSSSIADEIVGDVTGTVNADGTLTVNNPINLTVTNANDQDPNAAVHAVDRSVANQEIHTFDVEDDHYVNDLNISINNVLIDLDLSAANDEYADSGAGMKEAFDNKITELQAAGKLSGLTITSAVDDFGVGSQTTGDFKITIVKNAVTAVSDVSASAGLSTNAVLINTQSDASAAIATIDTAIEKVNAQRASLGAVSNRLDSTVNNLTSISSNLQAGRGRIEDADFAAETTSLAKSQILQQASTAMLAQANASKQNVLSLLQG